MRIRYTKNYRGYFLGFYGNGAPYNTYSIPIEFIDKSGKAMKIPKDDNGKKIAEMIYALE